MTWYDDGGNKPPHDPSGQPGRDQPDRFRCPVCSQYPKLNTAGQLRGHKYPWYHSRSGEYCPGSGTQVSALPGQLALGEEPH